MTIGAAALMMLETAPIRPNTAGAQPLTAFIAPLSGMELIVQQADSLQLSKWRNIVIHTTSGEPADVSRNCHFVIEPDGRAVVSAAWKQQHETRHVFAASRDYNADSIGICLAGDFSRSGPSSKQLNAAVELTRALQRQFTISPDNVYLCSEIDSRSHSPGDAFPSAVFSGRLLRIIR